MASGAPLQSRQSEMGADWTRLPDGRQATLKPSIDSDLGSGPEPRASTDGEPRKHVSASRRQSVRPAKQPQGARPLARSPSKLPTSGTTREPTRIPSASTAKPPVVARSRQSSYNLNQAFDFGTGPSESRASTESNRSQAFLPAVNFDDLHNSITAGEPGMNTATTTKRSLISERSLQNLKEQREQREQREQKERGRQSMLPSTTTVEAPVSKPGSFLRRQSSTRREGQGTGQPQPAHAMGPPPPTNTAARANRRQSHFPTSASTTSLSKPPRKSVGPGILTQSLSSYSFLQDEPQLNEHRQSTYRRRQSKHESAGSADMGDLRNGNQQSRASKTRSAYAPEAQNSDLLSTPVEAIENPWAMASRSPGENPPDGGTPGSGRRMSVNPAAAGVGGLGARTISPTDVKRMKRLSMMQNALRSSPSMTTDGVPPPFPAQYNQSPPMTATRRPSATPSLNRNTPDFSRRSRHNSVSSNNHGVQGAWQSAPGLTQGDAFSVTPKSPTLKARGEPQDDTEGADVPPVPAIPKAYESPKNEQDILFSTASRKSTLVQPEIDSEQSGSPAEYVSARSSKASYGEPIRIIDTPNSNRGYEDIQASLKNGADLASNRRKREAPRLPPLNLLPLSTPTTEKIAALQNRISLAGSGATTPPRKLTKTPTTPMTASKAAFPSRYHQKDGTAPVAIAARSNTSQFVINPGETASFRPPSSSESSARGTEKEQKGRVSPFVSSSLPKSASEYNVLRAKPSVDRSASTASSDAKTTKIAGPRAQPSNSHLRRQSVAQTTTTSTTTTTTAATDTESSSHSFGSNLRRRLSMTRRRSVSKAEDQPPQPPAHASMPPPKLPASATTNSLFSSQGSKTGFLHSRRKSSHPDTLVKQMQLQPENGETAAQEPIIRKSFEYRTFDPKVRPSLGSNEKLAQANGSGRYPRPAIDVKLDRDDQIAEQEMQKLALRRKKTEIEARELDALRQRAVPGERMSPPTALRACQLNVFERGEIVDYEDVYFAGTAKAQKVVGNLEAEAANFGYDDDRGDYNIVLGDHLAYRYEVIDLLGKGSFGQVVRCIDHKTGGLVAVKIIRNKKRFHQQALVEVNILQKLKEWDPEGTHSMVSFTQSFYFRGHLCISTELLGMNLYEFIKIHDFRGFSLKLIRRFAKQMLNSLVLLKGKKVIHCDLKPENILLAHPAHSEIKVIDFGSSCMEHEKVYTYIQSRFYRSPEVILGMNYGIPIDMWSLGCILAELLTGFPLFPGENEQEQLACIMEVFGPPDKHLIEKSTRRKLFFDSLGKPRPVVSSKGKRRRPSSKTLQQAIRCDDEGFIDFLTRCLRWDPDRRLKPDEAAQHEFVTGIKPQAQAKTIRSITQPHPVSVSPVRRINSTSTRPLPNVPTEPIASGRPSLSSSRPPQVVGNTSPTKGMSKRHSTVGGGVSLSSFGSKRAPITGSGTSQHQHQHQQHQQQQHQQSGASGLPRLGISRTVSGKQDLASAAAAVATAVSSGHGSDNRT